MGVVFLDATVTGSTGKQESVRFLVDTGVMYTLLPRGVWRAIGLRPTDSVKFALEDGTQLKRKLSECQIALEQGRRHTPVMLGAETDEAVLGRITLSEFGLMLNPFTRRLERMRLMLGQLKRRAMPGRRIEAASVSTKEVTMRKQYTEVVCDHCDPKAGLKAIVTCEAHAIDMCEPHMRKHFDPSACRLMPVRREPTLSEQTFDTLEALDKSLEPEIRSDLVHDLRKLDPESYEGFQRSVLKYALSLAEILADDRQTRMTFEEFEQLPDTLEYSKGFVEPKHWSFYGERNERHLASVRDHIAARLQAFVQTRELGRITIEGNAILVRGKADSALLAVLIEARREQVEEYLAQGAHVWNLSFMAENASIWQNTQRQIVPRAGSFEDPEVLPGFKLPLSEIFDGPEAEQE